MTSTNQDPSFSISPSEFKDYLETLLILDIRTPREFEDFNFGGIHIPLDELLLRINEFEHLKNDEIVVICYTGLQSEIARKILEKRGFSRLRNLEGGLEAFLNL